MIAIGSDHGGYELKKELIGYFEKNGLQYKDFGTDGPDAVDYPDIAKPVCKAIIAGEADKGILICGTGIGISMTANKIQGIRAALVHDVFSAEATRLHNDANVLCMGGRVVGGGLAIKITDTFLNTNFSGDDRHARRISKIEGE